MNCIQCLVLLHIRPPNKALNVSLVLLYVKDFRLCERALRGCSRARAENFAHRSQAATEDEKVTKLADMGFSRVDAIAALQSTANDENAALELLLSAA